MSSLRFHELTVKRVSPEAAGSVAVTFDIPEAERERFAFEPGQFLTLRATVNGQDVRRSYSISSPRSRLAQGGRTGNRHPPGRWAACLLQLGGQLELKAGDKLQRACRRTAASRYGSSAPSIASASPPAPASRPSCRFCRDHAGRAAREQIHAGAMATAACPSVMFNEALQDLKDRYRDRLHADPHPVPPGAGSGPARRGASTATRSARSLPGPACPWAQHGRSLHLRPG
jgi:ring-1,2-phenylacetyl-CoA epoxidase subunit PaaE